MGSPSNGRDTPTIRYVSRETVHKQKGYHYVRSVFRAVPLRQGYAYCYRVTVHELDAQDRPNRSKQVRYWACSDGFYRPDDDDMRIAGLSADNAYYCANC